MRTTYCKKCDKIVRFYTYHGTSDTWLHICTDCESELNNQFKLCIMAAGKGTRNNDVNGLHKGLLPLENKSVLSNIAGFDNVKREAIFSLAPPGFHFCERGIFGCTTATSRLFLFSICGCGVRKSPVSQGRIKTETAANEFLGKGLSNQLKMRTFTMTIQKVIPYIPVISAFCTKVRKSSWVLAKAVQGPPVNISIFRIYSTAVQTKGKIQIHLCE